MSRESRVESRESKGESLESRVESREAEGAARTGSRAVPLDSRLSTLDTEKSVESQETPSTHPSSLIPHPSRRAVFLDRDGVLNKDSEEFIKTPDEMELLPGAVESVARLNAAGFLCVVVTNQSGIARGLFDETALSSLHEKLNAEMQSGNAHVDSIYYCPHGPDDGCDCRKPATGMLTRAVDEHNINLAESWMVGDRPGDIACGAAAGCRTILVLTGKMQSYDPARFDISPDHVAADIAEAAGIIIANGQ